MQSQWLFVALALLLAGCGQDSPGGPGAKDAAPSAQGKTDLAQPAATHVAGIANALAGIDVSVLAPSQYFLDLKSGVFYTVPLGEVSPSTAPSGGAGVRARVFACDDGALDATGKTIAQIKEERMFLGYLERHPEEKLKTAHRLRAGEKLPDEEWLAFARREDEISTDGQKWHASRSEDGIKVVASLGTLCDKGGRLRTVVPQSAALAALRGDPLKLTAVRMKAIMAIISAHEARTNQRIDPTGAQPIGIDSVRGEPEGAADSGERLLQALKAGPVAKMLEGLDHEAIADTDGDGLQELLDGWGGMMAYAARVDWLDNNTADDYLPVHPRPFLTSSGPDGQFGNAYRDKGGSTALNDNVHSHQLGLSIGLTANADTARPPEQDFKIPKDADGFHIFAARALAKLNQVAADRKEGAYTFVSAQRAAAAANAPASAPASYRLVLAYSSQPGADGKAEFRCKLEATFTMQDGEWVNLSRKRTYLDYDAAFKFGVPSEEYNQRVNAHVDRSWNHVDAVLMF